jgi:hypothetical protein
MDVPIPTILVVSYLRAMTDPVSAHKTNKGKCGYTALFDRFYINYDSSI